MSLVQARRRAAAATVTVLLLFPLSACGGDNEDEESGAGPAASTKVTVLAASSLTDVFQDAGADFEKANPGTEVTFSFAGSQVLAAQVSQGAPADVLATANTKTMESVKADAGEPEVFAKNRLVIVVREGNPEGTETLKDLTDPGLKVVLASPEVPVGDYSKQILDRRNLDVKPVSRETNVRAVLSKVELGEADAGLVYQTDAATAPGKVDSIAIPDAQNEIATYPAATLKTSENAKAAREFVDFLTSRKAQKIFREAGFQKR